MKNMDEFVSKVKKGMTKAFESAEKLTSAAVSKTGNIVEQTKTNYAISNTEDRIHEYLAQIGQMVYEEYQSGSEFPEKIDVICKDIDALREEIASMKEKIADLKNAVVCPACGAYNDSDSSYCAKCGEKLN